MLRPLSDVETHIWDLDLPEYSHIDQVLKEMGSQDFEDLTGQEEPASDDDDDEDDMEERLPQVLVPSAGHGGGTIARQRGNTERSRSRSR